MRVVARKILARRRRKRLGHVRPQLQLGRIETRAVFLRRRAVRIVRRTPRQPEEKRLGLFCLRPRPHERRRRLRLVKRIVACPRLLLRGVAVVGRIVVGVRALQHLPIVKALPPLARDKTGAPVPVDVPLADRPRVVARRLQHLRQRHRLQAQRHVVEKNPVRERLLPREQRRPRRRTHRHARDRVREPHALGRESVDYRRLRVGIAGKPERLRAPLVREHEENIRRRGALRGGERGHRQPTAQPHSHRPPRGFHRGLRRSFGAARLMETKFSAPRPARAHLRFWPRSGPRGGPCAPRAAQRVTPRPAIRRPRSGRPTSGGVCRKVRCARPARWHAASSAVSPCTIFPLIPRLVTAHCPP